ncbi:MAG: TonB-dependent receptor, partial [Beijerinckiaceae bacterium]|nr:TonB-dependent receptor [Beijerinckiaceae bacterium]
QPNSRDDIVRASVRWKPADGIEADYKLTYFNSRVDGNGQEVGVCSDAYRASLIVAGSPEDCVIDYRKAPENIYPVGIVPKGFYTRNKGTSQSLNLSADVGGGLTLSSVTGYNDLESDWVSDGDWGALSIFNIYRPERNKQFSQEFRVQSDASKPVAVVVGAYYEHVSKRFSGIADGPGFGNISFFKLLRAKANSVALFGEVTARPVEGVSLIAGGRYTDIDQKGRLTADFGSLGDLGAGPETDATRKLPTDNFSPSFIAQYEFDRRAQIYASFKKGFKSGGFSIDGANPTYKDEKATSYELGAKVESTDRHLLLSVSLYRTDVSNMQVQAYAGTSPTSDITNVASARLEGAEVGARYRFSSQLSVDANFALSDAKYRRFPGAPCTIGQACPGGQQDLSGARLPLAPRRSFSLGADYRHPVVGDHELALSASVTHRSAVQLAIENDPLTRSPALTLADARVAIEPGNGASGFSAALVGRNIFDKKYVAGAIALPAADSFVYQVGVPRTIELQIGYRF